MAAVWAVARADLRGRWRGLLALALLVGIMGGVVLAAAAGARRTQTAMPRLLKATNAADALVSPQLNGLAGYYDDLRRLPQVEAVGVVAGTALLGVGPDGGPDLLLGVPPASIDGIALYTVHRPRIRAGRMPRKASTTEVLVNPLYARAHHLSVGSHFVLRNAVGVDQGPDADASKVLAAAPPARLTVVGIGTTPDEVVLPQGTMSLGGVVLSPAAFPVYANEEDHAYDGAFVRLKPGASLDAFHAAATALAKRHPEAGDGLYFSSLADRYRAVNRTIRPTVISLFLFALLGLVAAVAVIGQVLARRVASTADDAAALRALGFSRSQLVAGSVASAGASVLLGGCIAFALATVASPLMPIGPARHAEPHGGFAVNVAVLVAGTLALVALLAGRSAIAAWRLAGNQVGTVAFRPSRLADAAARGGLPSTASAGLRLALEPGRASNADPGRAALVGTAVAMAAVVAALTFVANLNRLVSTPSLYGWNLDAQADASFGAVPADQAVPRLKAVPGVAAVAGGDYGDLTIGNQTVPAVGIDPITGSIFPTLTAGRAPQSAGEVVLGATTLRRMHARVGQTVSVRISTSVRSLHIVGQAVFPSLGHGGFPPTSLGEGAGLTAAGLGATDHERGTYNFFLIRYRAGSDPAAVTRRLTSTWRSMCPPDQACALLRTRRPSEINDYASVRWTPLALAAMLVVLAVLTVGHALISSVRRRRRDFAVLQTLGFVRRQVSATIAWQATALVGLALLFGVPVGIAFGRWSWLLFSHQLGVGSAVRTPAIATLLAIAIAVVLANVIAAIPARMASRVPPAVALRTE